MGSEVALISHAVSPFRDGRNRLSCLSQHNRQCSVPRERMYSADEYPTIPGANGAHVDVGLEADATVVWDCISYVIRISAGADTDN